MGSGKPADQVIRPPLEAHTAGGGQVAAVGEASWRLTIPAGPNRLYRLAQLDDYHNAPRRSFPWRPPVTMSLRARVSAPDIAGTWGFGFWNDPFSLSLGLGGGEQRLPALPNAAWFFHASPENHLSLRDDLPARGLLAATFCSPRIPSILLGLAVPALPLLLILPLSRQMRRVSRRLIQQDAIELHTDQTKWQEYRLSWTEKRVEFFVNGRSVFNTCVVPQAPLGFVLWIDNQFAAWKPDGRITFGSLELPRQALLEIDALTFREG